MGTGISKIRRLLAEAGLKPPCFEFGTFFTVIFTRPVNRSSVEDDIAATQKGTQKSTRKTTQKIIDLVQKNPFISRRELAVKIGTITEDGVKYNLDRLVKSGKMHRIGPDKGGRWEIIRNA